MPSDLLTRASDKVEYEPWAQASRANTHDLSTTVLCDRYATGIIQYRVTRCKKRISVAFIEALKTGKPFALTGSACARCTERRVLAEQRAIESALREIRAPQQASFPTGTGWAVFSEYIDNIIARGGAISTVTWFGPLHPQPDARFTGTISYFTPDQVTFLREEEEMRKTGARYA